MKTPAPGLPAVRRFVVCLLLVIGLGLPGAGANLLAQSAPAVEAGKAFKVAVVHDGVFTTQYVLKVDRPGTLATIVTTLPVSSLVSGEVTFDVAGQSVVGAYVAKVCARNVDATDPALFAERCSADLPFTVMSTLPAPSTTPTIRIIGTISVDGGPVQPVVLDVASVTAVIR
jgi:hypothetical protein